MRPEVDGLVALRAQAEHDASIRVLGDDTAAAAEALAAVADKITDYFTRTRLASASGRPRGRASSRSSSSSGSSTAC
jgi:hypothetical protein